MKLREGKIHKLIGAHIEVPRYEKLVRHARANGKTMQQLLSERLLPWIDQLPEDESEGG